MADREAPRAGADVTAARMPEPSCPLGYTEADLQQHWGGRLKSLYATLAGQTGSICDGRSFNHETREYEPTACAEHPHGFTTYVHDVRRWLEGKPVID